MKSDIPLQTKAVFPPSLAASCVHVTMGEPETKAEVFHGTSRKVAAGTSPWPPANTQTRQLEFRRQSRLKGDSHVGQGGR